MSEKPRTIEEFEGLAFSDVDFEACYPNRDLELRESMSCPNLPVRRRSSYEEKLVVGRNGLFEVVGGFRKLLVSYRVAPPRREELLIIDEKNK